MNWGLQAKRRLVQTLSTLLLSSNFTQTTFGGACIPVLWCEACSMTWLGCPIGLMASTIAFHEVPWLVLLILLGSAALVGRWFCGWVCPSGLIQDLLHKIPSNKFELPRWTKAIKYLVLIGPVILIAYFFNREHGFSFCSWCPTATASVAIPQALQFHTFGIDWQAMRWIILVLVLAFAVMSHRSFCKVLCPIGAMVSLTGRYSLLAIRMNANQCGRCKACDKKCPMDVRVESCKDSGKRINADPECINCLTCEDACTRKVIHNNSWILGRQQDGLPQPPAYTRDNEEGKPK